MAKTQPAGQFTVIQTKTLYSNNLSPMCKVILTVIQSHANIDGYCFPSYERIANEAGCCRKSAINYVNKLIKEGYLCKVKGVVPGSTEQSANCYWVNNNPVRGEWIQEELNKLYPNGMEIKTKKTARKKEKAGCKIYTPKKENVLNKLIKITN